MSKIFTEEEKIIAKNFNPRLKYIARDKDGELYLFNNRPVKNDYMWSCVDIWDKSPCQCGASLFKAIKWLDDQPVKIRDIYDPQLLTNNEKQYLNTVLKPWEETIFGLKKTLADQFYYCISILYTDPVKGDTVVDLPYRDSDNEYTGLEPNHTYSIAELHLFEEDD